MKKKLPIYLYNHTSALDYLRRKPFPFAHEPGNLWVELNDQPSLAFACALETPVGFPGLAGLLASQTVVKELCIGGEEGAVPLLLAPASAQASVIAEGWHNLALNHPQSLPLGLLSLEAAPRILPLIQTGHPLAILWDLRIPPSGQLTWLEAATIYLRENPDLSPPAILCYGSHEVVSGQSDLSDLLNEFGLIPQAV